MISNPQIGYCQIILNEPKTQQLNVINIFFLNFSDLLHLYLKTEDVDEQINIEQAIKRLYENNKNIFLESILEILNKFAEIADYHFKKKVLIILSSLLPINIEKNCVNPLITCDNFIVQKLINTLVTLASSDAELMPLSLSAFSKISKCDLCFDNLHKTDIILYDLLCNADDHSLFHLIKTLNYVFNFVTFDERFLDIIDQRIYKVISQDDIEDSIFDVLMECVFNIINLCLSSFDCKIFDKYFRFFISCLNSNKYVISIFTYVDEVIYKIYNIYSSFIRDMVSASVGIIKSSCNDDTATTIFYFWKHLSKVERINNSSKRIFEYFSDEIVSILFKYECNSVSDQELNENDINVIATQCLFSISKNSLVHPLLCKILLSNIRSRDPCCLESCLSIGCSLLLYSDTNDYIKLLLTFFYDSMECGFYRVKENAIYSLKLVLRLYNDKREEFVKYNDLYVQFFTSCYKVLCMFVYDKVLYKPAIETLLQYINTDVFDDNEIILREIVGLLYSDDLELKIVTIKLLIKYSESSDCVPLITLISSILNLIKSNVSEESGNMYIICLLVTLLNNILLNIDNRSIDNVELIMNDLIQLTKSVGSDAHLFLVSQSLLLKSFPDNFMKFKQLLFDLFLSELNKDDDEEAIKNSAKALLNILYFINEESYYQTLLERSYTIILSSYGFECKEILILLIMGIFEIHPDVLIRNISDILNLYYFLINYSMSLKNKISDTNIDQNHVHITLSNILDFFKVTFKVLYNHQNAKLKDILDMFIACMEIILSFSDIRNVNVIKKIIYSAYCLIIECNCGLEEEFKNNSDLYQFLNFALENDIENEIVMSLLSILDSYRYKFIHI